MRTNVDLTELTLDDSTLYMVNDLIFTNAGELMNVVEKTEKKGCDNGCDCLDCDDEVGDNVTW